MEDSVPYFAVPHDSPGPAGDVAPPVVEVLPHNDPQSGIVALPHGLIQPGDSVSEAVYEDLADLCEFFGETGSASSPPSTLVAGSCPAYQSVGRAGDSPHDSGRFKLEEILREMGFEADQ